MNQTFQIRPDLREEAFRKYEQHLWQIVQAYPVTYTLRPKNVRTFAARLRDAKKSLLDYQWTSSLNMEKFKEVYDDLIILERGTDVICGSRKRMKADNLVLEPAEVIPSNEVIDVGIVHNPGGVIMLCILAQARALSKPIQFVSNSVNQTDLEESFDIGLKRLEDNKWVIS